MSREESGAPPRVPVVPGLCSVTFRALPGEEVVGLAADAGLGAIEWGADVHAPPGDPARARVLADRCADVGIRCPSYGSYFFAGQHPAEALDPVIETAQALGATWLRVWTPLRVESDAPADRRAAIAEALAAAADRAADAGLGTALEFHPGTLTHTAASANALLDAAGRPGLRTYWQPLSGASARDSLAELAAVRPRLAHLHVFAWEGQPPRRLPLAEHAELWRPALRSAAAADGFGERAAYLEFVTDDAPEAFARDARTLRDWLREETG